MGAIREDLFTVQPLGADNRDQSTKLWIKKARGKRSDLIGHNEWFSLE